MNGYLHVLAIALLLTPLFSGSAQAQEKNAPGAPAGQPLSSFARVVLADDALAVARTAAEELSNYVGKMLGKSPLPIVTLSKYKSDEPGLSFFVGEKAAEQALGKSPAPWKQEEYLLQAVPQGLVLAGSDEKGAPWSASIEAGSMLATYTLLDDHLGVKWFWPGPMGEHVPAGQDKVVPALNVRATPRFLIRTILLGYSKYHTPEFKEEARKWARRNRQGWAPSAYFGHSWWYAFDLKNNKSFEEHPEWFALVNGKRRPPQVCTTNPQVLDRMVEHVLTSKYDICSISPSDGGGFCMCDEKTKSDAHRAANAPSCTSLDVPGYMSYDNKTIQLSDRIMTYANTVARRVAEKDPKKRIGMLAYTFYNKPPVKVEKLEPNILLSFVFHAAGLRDPELVQQWDQTTRGWQSKGANMVLRESWGCHYFLDLPFPHEAQIANCLSDAANRGFLAAYGEGTKGFANHAPNVWAVTHMSWDPSRDPKAMMDDFYQSAYGPVAQEMREYFGTYSRSLDENWAKRVRVIDTPGLAYVNIINSWHLFYPPSVVDRAEEWLKKAEAMAPAGEYRERLKLHRIGQDYTRCFTRLLDCYRQLAQLGMKMEFFSLPDMQIHNDPARKAALLKEAYELGKQREQLLLLQRNWAALDEGMYAFTNDSNLRQWHAHVKRELGIKEPSLLTLETLVGPKAVKNGSAFDLAE